MIILLNGTSSSGKTTLAKALQRALPAPHLHIGIDTVVFALPPQHLDAPLWHEVFEYQGSGEELQITAGPLGDRLVGSLHRMVAAAAGTGWDVIVDHVLLDARWVADAAAVLGDHPLLAVGVRCPLEEVVRREQARRDRTLGQARAQLSSVHAHAGYDIEVDTSRHDPRECAEIIIEALAGYDGRSVLGQRAVRGGHARSKAERWQAGPRCDPDLGASHHTFPGIGAAVRTAVSDHREEPAGGGRPDRSA